MPDRGRVVAVEDQELAQGEELERRAEAFRGAVSGRLDGLGEQLNRCYLPELKRDPGLAGYVVIDFTVGAGGRLTQGPEIRESTLGNLSVEQCVIEVVSAQEYPPPFGVDAVDVSRVFQFGAF